MLRNCVPFYLGITILFMACAQVKPIPGGDKDHTPPQVLRWIPENAQTMFTAKGFSIEFDEYIALQNIQTELVVSPPLQAQPVVTIRKKTVIVQWKEDLKPSTTYNFQFGDGVVDVNEANKVPNLQFVFSTGQTLDSARCQFQVMDNKSGEWSKNARVLLFENDSDFFNVRPRPAYISKTDANGKAEINYIRSSKYFVYALDDANGNYRADDGELVGFLPAPIEAQALDTVPKGMRLCETLPEKKRVESYIIDSTGTLHFHWPAAWGEVQVTTLEGPAIRTWQDTTRDSIWAFIQEKPKDAYVRVVVSADADFKDTLEIPFFNQVNDRWKIQAPTNKYIPSEQILFEGPFEMVCTNQAQSINTSDSTVIEGSWRKGLSPNQWQLTAPFMPGRYKGVILPGTFVNVSGVPNDSLKMDFQIFGAKELGSLEVDLSKLRQGGMFFLELLNKQNVVVKTWPVNQPGKLKLLELIPGEYGLRLWEDTNKNGVADLANPRQFVEAEKYTYLSKSILIRANWEVQLQPELNSELD
jgi:uncharacterized protein (DUF2141 family)